MSLKTVISSGKSLKWIAALAAVILVAHYGFAVDGTQGGRKSTKVYSAKVYSSIKNNLNLSLKSMYGMSNPANLQVRRGAMISNPYSVITFHKGNQTWVMPHRNNMPKILQKFKGPSR